jgi:diacylglycerol O-acyltransferase / wax synthase
MGDQLTALDASFLELEQLDESAHMHIGGVLVFEPLPDGGAPGLERLRAHLDRRLDRLPRYRQRLSARRTGGLAWPSWQPDEVFDLSAHVRCATLPAPGGDDELLGWASDFYSHRLDRAHPLWEIVLVDGLAGERWALASKTHHCMVDGVGSIDAGYVLLDTEPEPGEAAAEGPEGTGGPPGEYTGGPPGETRESGVLPGLVGRGARLAEQVAEAGAHAVLHPRETLVRSRAMAEMLVRDELHRAPRSSLNVTIGGRRRLAVVRLRLDEAKEIKRRLGGTVNDVVLAVVAGGLRALLEHRGEKPPARGLRAMVPVNARTDVEHGAMGNRVTSLFVDLPVAEANAFARYERVVEATTELKAGRLASGSQALIDLTALAPPAVHAALAGALFAPRLFNVTITNVPGPQLPLYALGARMREVIPLVPLFAEHAVGIAVISYDGELVFGINADHETVPDGTALAAGIEREFAELRALVRDGVAGGSEGRG